MHFFNILAKLRLFVSFFVKVTEMMSEFNIYQMPKGDENDEQELIDHLDKIRRRQPFACMNRNRSARYNPMNEAYSDTSIQ